MSSPIRASSLLFKNTAAQAGLKGLRSRLAEVEQQAVTGVKVRRASDAPGKWPGVQDLSASIADQDIFKENAGRATSVLGVADSALGEGSNLMKRARELAVRFANGSFNDDDRAAAAAEVDGLRDSMIGLGNTDLAGRHVFAGTNYDSPPFDAAGVYSGSTDVPTVALGKGGDAVDAGFDGGAVFGDALASLTDLANALRTGTNDDVRDEIDVVDGAMRKVIDARSDAGVHYNRAEDVKVLSDNLKFALNEGLNSEIAADPFETFQHFTELAQHMEATLQLTSVSNSMPGLFARI